MEIFFYVIATKLLALSVIVQFTEYLYLRPALADDGIWSWRVLRTEYSRPAQRTLAIIYSERGTTVVIVTGLLSALAMYAAPELPFSMLVFLCCLLMSARFRGTFNGGSDFMTLTVAGALALTALSGFAPVLTPAAFLYVGAQVTLSYFIAGLVKVRERGWRDGTLLPRLLAIEKYGAPAAVKAFAANRALMLAGSWGIIVFECTFPIALLAVPLLWIYLFAGLLFHAANVAIFGLNRFFFAWLASYPLLYTLA